MKKILIGKLKEKKRKIFKRSSINRGGMELVGTERLGGVNKCGWFEFYQNVVDWEGANERAWLSFVLTSVHRGYRRF